MAIRPRVRLSLVATLASLLAAACAGESSESAIVPDLLYVESIVEPASDRRLDVYVPAGDGPHPSAAILHGGGADRAEQDVTAVAGAYFIFQEPGRTDVLELRVALDARTHATDDEVVGPAG